MDITSVYTSAVASVVSGVINALGLQPTGSSSSDNDGASSNMCGESSHSQSGNQNTRLVFYMFYYIAMNKWVLCN